MQVYSHYRADPTKILSRREMQAVLADLKRKAPRSAGTRLNLIVFRLPTGCGLRASEMAQLQLADVLPEMPKPHLRIRAGAAKGGRPRIVPLWWDAGTLADVAEWKRRRLQEGAKAEDSFIVSPGGQSSL